MPQLDSKYFGKLEFSPDAVFQFRCGIPAYEDQAAFVFLQQPQANPLVFMQSLSDPDLCFITVPVSVADPVYRLELGPEDLTALGLSHDRAPVIGSDVLCLALVTVTEDSDPTVNLAAPIVLNLKNQQGIQGIQTPSGYSYRRLLPGQEALVTCS